MPWLLFKSRIGVRNWNRLKERGLVAVCCKHDDKPLIFVRC